MKEVLNVIISNLVDNVNEIEIKETENEKSVLFEVKVAEADMGKVIGRQGRVAKSIRNVMKAFGAKQHKKVTVEFIG